ncbi:hypothetical protein DUI87_33499 [Hirundo rustica rustica]|uniref:Uncharacterized protein n=1 Tax=Hirundo rustica rustica TaxID=333673 RepID=A0A3M0INT5_HIRRU|nr:hypothetical protein DUI87_33499 [Hirundo rustica rustica]
MKGFMEWDVPGISKVEWEIPVPLIWDGTFLEILFRRISSFSPGSTVALRGLKGKKKTRDERVYGAILGISKWDGKFLVSSIQHGTFLEYPIWNGTSVGSQIGIGCSWDLQYEMGHSWDLLYGLGHSWYLPYGMGHSWDLQGGVGHSRCLPYGIGHSWRSSSEGSPASP